MPLQTITGRTQIEFFCLEQLIEAENPVRVIEAFVEEMNMEEMGFHSPGKSHEGRPAFSSKTMLILYLYGYQHGIRSSRKLEAVYSGKLRFFVNFGESHFGRNDIWCHANYN